MWTSMEKLGRLNLTWWLSQLLDFLGNLDTAGRPRCWVVVVVVVVDMTIESATGLPWKFGYSWSISNPLPLKHFLKVPFGIQLVTRVVNLGNRPLTSLLCPHFVNLRWDEGSYSDEADRIASHEQLFRVSNWEIEQSNTFCSLQGFFLNIYSWSTTMATVQCPLMSGWLTLWNGNCHRYHHAAWDHIPDLHLHLHGKE